MSRSLFVGCLVLVNVLAAFASANTNSVNVSVTVTPNCTISAGPLAFGTYDPTVVNASTALNGTATMSVACTTAAPATILLGQGANATTSSTDSSPLRRLNNGSNFLSYNVYQDSSRSTTWGNTSGTGLTYTGTGSSTSLTAYAAVAGGQNVPTGSYSDTVVVTVTF